MRVAHLIIVHKNPAQLLRLLKRLEHPNFDLFVHVDKKISILDFELLKKEVDFTFIEHRTTCHWGGNSFIESIITSLREILSSGKHYDFINLISGQDYPLMPPEKMLEYFQANRGINFISYDDSRNSKWWESARSRYEKYHLTDQSFRGKYIVQTFLNTFLPKRKFNHFRKLWGGSKSSWWTITSPCAKLLVETMINNRKLNQFLKYTWGNDEFIVATIIMNSKFKDVTQNENLRYIDWSEQNANPKILRLTDIQALEESKMMFARKFDIVVDTDILTLIDRKLLGIQ